MVWRRWFSVISMALVISCFAFFGELISEERAISILILFPIGIIFIMVYEFLVDGMSRLEHRGNLLGINDLVNGEVYETIDPIAYGSFWIMRLRKVRGAKDQKERYYLLLTQPPHFFQYRLLNNDGESEFRPLENFKPVTG